MPALIVYLLKVNVALCLFYLTYRFLLRRLTFYYLNRFFLAFGILFSSIYPFIDLPGLFAKHEALSRQLIIIVPDWQTVAPIITQTKIITTFDYWQIPLTLFWIGVVFMTARLAVQFISLYKVHKDSNLANYNGQPYRSVKDNTNPFSFWQAIYLNPENHQSDELQSIIKHEQVHVEQWHTLDVLLAELSTVFYWFNPGVWLMKRAVKENLEFITDRKILQSGIDEKAYQYSLIRVSNLKQSSAIVNNFNFLTIKKRILMMNKKRSSKAQVTRYIILCPLVILLALVFTASKAELNSKTISSFVKKVLPKVLVSNIKPQIIVPVTHQKTIVKSDDTTRISQAIDTPLFSHHKNDFTVSANDSTIVNHKNNAITLYGAARLINQNDTLRGNYIQLKSKGELNLHKAIYVIISGNNKVFAKGDYKVKGLEAAKIDSINVLRSNDAVTQYGVEAKYGAVVIKMKPNVFTSAQPTMIQGSVIPPDDNEIIFVIVPNNKYNPMDYEAAYKQFSDNGFLLDIKGKVGGRSLTDSGTMMAIKISIKSKKTNAFASANYDITKMTDTKYAICIKANKKTGDVSITSENVLR